MVGAVSVLWWEYLYLDPAVVMAAVRESVKAASLHPTGGFTLITEMMLMGGGGGG